MPGQPVVAVDGEGLRLVDGESGRTTPLPFGTAEDRVLQALDRAAGALATEEAEKRGCADNASGWSWSAGLTVVVRDDAFVGWELDPRSDGTISTLSGAGIGSTREHLEWSYSPQLRREARGVMFVAGGLRGTLEGEGDDARVTSMWAGEPCERRAAPTELEPITPETHGALFEGIPPFSDLVATRDGDWLVVLGSFPVAPGEGLGGGVARDARLMRASDPGAAEAQQRLWNAGVVPFAVRSDILPNFTPGLVVLVVGPFPRADAERRLAELQDVVPDAYLKRGW